MIWLLTLPFRIVFGLLGLVFGLIGGGLALVAGLVALVLLPIAFLFWIPGALLHGAGHAFGWLLVALLAGVVAVALFALALVPLVPLLLVLGVVWLLRRRRTPARIMADGWS